MRSITPAVFCRCALIDLLLLLGCCYRPPHWSAAMNFGSGLLIGPSRFVYIVKIFRDTCDCGLQECSSGLAKESILALKTPSTNDGNFHKTMSIL